MKTCPCGSGKTRRELRDARGIFCKFICDDCEERKRADFCAEIFNNPDYEADEQIEED